jgi:hypothetical protein
MFGHTQPHGHRQKAKETSGSLPSVCSERRLCQEVKTAKARCPGKDVSYNIMMKLHQGKAIDSMAHNHSDSNLKTFRNTDQTKTDRQLLTGNVKIYPDYSKVVDALHERECVSMVVHGPDSQCGVLFYHKGKNMGRNVRMVPIERSENHTVHHGLRYWSWTLAPQPVPFESISVVDYGVLLPRLGVVDNVATFVDEFTMVTKEWSPAMFGQFEFSRVEIKDEDIGGAEFD